MYIGIDIGGTNTRITSFETLTSPVGEIIKFDTLNIYDEALLKIKESVDKITGGNIEGVGVGVAAFIDGNKNQIINANNISDWNGRSLKTDLENIFKCKIMMENDATVAAMGEAQFGKGIGLDDFLYITWGTGIGGTFIHRFENRLISTPSQPGHQIIEKDGLICSCGQKGCLEAYCGGWAISDEADWEKVEKYFVHGLINILSIHPTKMIIFSGSVALNQKLRVEKIMRLLINELKMVSVPEFVFSDLGEKVGLLGTIIMFT